MLNTISGNPVARIEGGHNNGQIICIDENCTDGYDEIELQEDSKLVPILNCKDRQVAYVAGPAGSGKSTYCAMLIRDYLKIFPDCEFYVFSRTDAKNDNAFNGLKINQIKVDESLLTNPIDIEKELGYRSLLFFDDCNTIQNDKVRKYIEKLMGDIMEVGRKLNIAIVITNHLVIPSEKAYARTVLNEFQSLTVFPKSGSSQQISYCLKTYFGLRQTQINQILDLNSRWVTINKQYPMLVMYQGGIYIL